MERKISDHTITSTPDLEFNYLHAHFAKLDIGLWDYYGVLVVWGNMAHRYI